MRDGFFVGTQQNNGFLAGRTGFRTDSEQTYGCVANEISSVCYEVENN